MATQPSQPKRTMVEAAMVAKLFNLTVRRIQQLTQDGVLTTELVDKKRRYDLLLTVQKYIAYLQEKVAKKGEKQGRRRKREPQNQSRRRLSRYEGRACRYGT